MSLLVGLPTYDGTRYNTTAIVRFLKEVDPAHVHLVETRSSLLPYSFNLVWATALNMRPSVTHLLLWHADISPTIKRWLVVLFEEMEHHKADVLSVVVPIKNQTGLTSTALDTDPWEPRRYSLKEVHEGPVTWTHPQLLINTGLMLVDFTKPWVEQVHFQLRDTLVRTEKGWQPYTEPEDWNFSRQCHALGVSLYATRAVTVDHVGPTKWSSSETWGYATDDEWRATRDSGQ